MNKIGGSHWAKVDVLNYVDETKCNQIGVAKEVDQGLQYNSRRSSSSSDLQNTNRSFYVPIH